MCKVIGYSAKLEVNGVVWWLSQVQTNRASFRILPKLSEPQVFPSLTKACIKDAVELRGFRGNKDALVEVYEVFQDRSLIDLDSVDRKSLLRSCEEKLTPEELEALKESIKEVYTK